MSLSAPEELRTRYTLGRDVRDWSVTGAKADIIENFGEKHLRSIAYRPFDARWTYYTGNSRGFLCYPRYDVMRHLIDTKNMAVGYTRTIEGSRDFADIFVYDSPITHHTLSIKEVNALAPLYLYPSDTAEQADAFAPKHRTLNLDPKLYAAICAAAGIDPADQAGPEEDFRAPTGDARASEVKVFDYIYGVLHAPDYRKAFAEFLKIDFPRIPYPPSPEIFKDISEQGETLRRLHLMEPAAIGDTPYLYEGPEDGSGDDMVASGYPKFVPNLPSPSGEGSGVGPVSTENSPDGRPTKNGRVHINPHQYFENVPEIAWHFHIGGYQPAQKWLKDRRGRVLSYDDISHYQKIIKILGETDRIMQGIKLPLETEGDTAS